MGYADNLLYEGATKIALGFGRLDILSDDPQGRRILSPFF
jgi:hypothetical protein